MTVALAPRPCSLDDLPQSHCRSAEQSEGNNSSVEAHFEYPGARIVIPQEGGSLRTIITGTKKHATGVLQSRKTGYRQYWEGFPERMMILESEVDHRVTDYQTQPFRFEFVLNGRPTIYIPDHCRQLRDGSVEVIEVKRSAHDLRDPEYASKLNCAQDLCARLGWHFKVALLGREHIPWQRQANLELLHARRFVSIGYHHLQILNGQHRSDGPAAYFGDLQSKLAPNQRQNGAAILHALIAHGKLAVDLDRPLVADSIVHFVESIPSMKSAFRS